MKEIYEHPEMEIILFANEDVVVTSTWTAYAYLDSDSDITGSAAAVDLDS